MESQKPAGKGITSIATIASAAAMILKQKPKTLKYIIRRRRTLTRKWARGLDSGFPVHQEPKDPKKK